MEFTDEQLKNGWSFLVQTFEFTEEQNAAIDHQIPMTQTIYDSILERCMEIGEDADKLFYDMLLEYPDFMTEHANRIERELMKDYPNGIPKSSPEELQAGWEKLCKMICEEFGEDAI